MERQCPGYIQELFGFKGRRAISAILSLKKRTRFFAVIPVRDFDAEPPRDNDGVFLNPGFEFKIPNRFPISNRLFS